MTEKKDRTNLVASAMRHKNITLLLVVMMMLAGVFSLVKIPKNEFPQFNIPVGLVVGVYPGASEQEVERQLARPMEEFLWTFKEVNKQRTKTICVNNACAAMVYLDRSVADQTAFWSKMKGRLPLLKAKLPDGVVDLVVNDEFGESSSMLVTLEGEGKSYREMGDYVDGLSDRLRTVPGLANIVRMGGQKEQLSIYLDRDRLSLYGINTAMLMSKVSGLNGTFYSGSLDDGQLSRAIHVQPSLNSENDLAQAIISSDPTGGVVRLGDIATIEREYPDPRQYIRNNGQKCILLSLQMTRGANVIEFGGRVKEIISDYQATLPDDVHINIISDQSQVVGHSIEDFMWEMLIAIVSVVIVVMLMLPLRVAGVAVATIPITIFSSLGLFLLFGLEINTVTLAALIVSLGMIVDDSVVVVDCYLDKLDAGVSRWKAAIESSREFVKSIITATLVISITFFPLIFTTDQVIHDFLQWFPYSISIVLTVSLLVAIFFVPILQYRFIRQGLKRGEGLEVRGEGLEVRGENRVSMLDRLQHVYDRMIEACFRHKKTTMAVGLACIVAGGMLMTLIPQRLMPRAERNQFTVDVMLPSGTDLHHTAAVADSLASILRQDPRVANLTVFYGSGAPRFHATFIPSLGGSNFAQFIVNTHSDAETQGMLNDYSEPYAYHFADAQVMFRQLEYSDRTYPIEVKVQGDNLDSLHVAVDSIRYRLARNKDIAVLTTSFGTNYSSLEVVMNPEEANHFGLSKSLLSLNFALRYGGGLPVTSIWEGDHEVNVVIKDANGINQTVEDFKNIRVTGLLPTLTTASLSQVADVKPGWGDGNINRTGGQRTASVFGMTGRSAVIGKVTKEVYSDLQTLRLPKGITMQQGGQAEMEAVYRPQLYLGLEIAVLLIFFIIVFHLKSIPLTLLIMYSLGFATLGGALGMLVFGQEFGATGILGFIALMGIITRCGIIMIDYAEELRLKESLDVATAAIESAKRRFRPVFLTSMAASMGVIPMVIKNTPLWGPMGVVIFLGALVSMLFIITMIPVGYCMVRNRFNSTNDEHEA
ncbi:MAG: efflux RND transporter permease subunit [Prevotella sp.]|nr:efflux RND transporter permease subunit [Prevotella sp.]